MSMFSLRALVLASVLATATTAADATVVYNNMNTDMPIVVNAVADSQNGPLFASFTAPTANSNVMTDLQLLLSAGDDDGGVLVTVYDDFSTSPSSPLAYGFISDAAINASQGSNGWAAINLPAYVPLLDNDCACGDNTFWIGVMDAQDAGNVGAGDDPYDTATATSAVWANDGNNSYPLESNYVGSNNPQINLNEDTNSFVMCVVVDGEPGDGSGCAPAPEPGTFGVIGVALAGLGFVRLRRRGRRA